MENAKTNEHILKANVTANIPEALELGKRYLMSITLDVDEIADKDNHDGTVNKVYKAKCNGEIALLDEGKNIIKAKDKGTMSKKLHGAMFYQANERGEDFDEFYQANMKKIVARLPEVLDYLSQFE